MYRNTVSSEATVTCVHVTARWRQSISLNNSASLMTVSVLAVKMYSIEKHVETDKQKLLLLIKVYKFIYKL